MFWLIDSCQNSVSADQYRLTVSRAQVSTLWVRAHGLCGLSLYTSNDLTYNSIRFTKPLDILTANSKKRFRRIFSYDFGCKQKALSDFLTSSSSWKKANTGKPAWNINRLMLTWLMIFTGAPNDNFRKISVRKTIWDLEFSRNICCKMSCLLTSPRRFEHLENGTFAHF